MALKQKFRGVSWKFLAILIPTVALTAVLAITLYVYNRLSSAEEALLSKIEVIADVHSGAVAHPLWTLDTAGLRRSIQTIALYPEIVCVEVVEPNLEQEYRTPENCTSDSEGAMTHTKELAFADKTVGHLNLTFTNDIFTAGLIREIIVSATFSLLLVTVVGIVAYVAMHLIVARPLHRLINSIKQSDRQVPRLPVDWSSQDELGSVMRAYNEMIREVEDNNYELIAAREQAESAAQVKTRFLTNVSHELRTPLNAVIGITEMLKEQAEEEEIDTEPYERITGSGRHLLHLIDDLLDFSKIEAGKTDISVEKVDMFELIEDVLALVQALADNNNNELVRQYNGQPKYLMTDPLRLSQIILNLLGNACKFTKNGQILLTVKECDEPYPNGVFFSVQDNGIGIADDRREHLFEEFSQADSSTTRQYGGTGLGLAISQKLCGLLGGQIELESRLGEGSTFSFVLPVKPEIPNNKVT